MPTDHAAVSSPFQEILPPFITELVQLWGAFVEAHPVPVVLWFTLLLFWLITR